MKSRKNLVSLLISGILLQLALVQNTWAIHPLIQVPLKSSAKVRFFGRDLISNPLSNVSAEHAFQHLDKMEFKVLEVHSGETLEVDSLLFSENVLAIFSDLTRGTDALQAGDLQRGIDAVEPLEFLTLFLELARLRRHAESIQEWEEIVPEKVRPKRAAWNAYLFKTPFVVVVSKKPGKSSAGAEEKRYYVPLDEIMAGAEAIDVHSAKLKISQSMSLKVLESLGDLEEEGGDLTVQSELNKMEESLQNICLLANHDFSGEKPVGCFITDLGFLHCEKAGVDLSEADQTLFKIRKRIAVLQLVKGFFPRLTGLEKLEELNQRTEFQVDCRNRETLTRGFSEEE